MNPLVCTNMRADAKSCGRCPECKDCQKQMVAMFEAAKPNREIALALNIQKQRVADARIRWGRGNGYRVGRLGRKVGTEHDIYVQRPLCTCGLSVSDTHGPDNCDLGLHTTGLGSWAGLSW